MHVAISRRIRDLDTCHVELLSIQSIRSKDNHERHIISQQVRLKHAKEYYASSRIQGIIRGYLARNIYRELLLRNKSAIHIQRVSRGWLGRLEWKHEYWKSVSVVKSHRALRTMLQRSRTVREHISKKTSSSSAYHWKELFDPLTASFWYYNCKSGENTWDCPLPLQHRLVCTWDGYAEYGGLPSQPPCRLIFSDLRSYLNHISTAHTWFCIACEHRNNGASFPMCFLCGNTCGDGEGGSKGDRVIHDASAALETNLTLMKRRISKFMKRDAGAGKKQRAGHRLKDRLGELAVEQRRSQLSSLRVEDGSLSVWEMLHSIRFNEEPLHRATVRSITKLELPQLVVQEHRVERTPKLGDISPMDTLLTVSMNDLWAGGIPQPAFEKIVRGEGGEIHTAAGGELFNDGDYGGVILADGGIFVCSAFLSNMCSNTNCPLAHPGLRDKAVYKYYAPHVPGLRKRPYVEVCEAGMQSACLCPPMTCTKYHIYIRPSTADIIRRIYPMRSKMRVRVLRSGVVEYRGRETSDGFEGFGVMTWKDRAAYIGEWINGKREGSGLLSTVDGFEYAGGWVAGVRHGFGRYSHPDDNEVYLGEFKDGQIEGAGHWEARDGSVYEGMFRNNMFDGIGVLSRRSGDTFIGHWSAGLMQGFGTYSLRSGEKFKGFFDRGLRHGRGICVLSSGAKYYGGWYRGLPSGKGVFLAPTQSIVKHRRTCLDEDLLGKYVGELESGFIHGKGTYIFANGDFYEGEWRRNKANGVGTYFHIEGNVYSGQWRDNQRCGHGTYSFINGSVYTGYFERNKLNGRGIFKYASGASYRGVFMDSQKHGKGVFVWPNGNEYRGTFEFNMMSGYGEMVYRSGYSYKGNWVNNKKHGKGVFVYRNGDIYDGNFKDDIRHGKGRMVYFPGTVIEESYEGDWSADEKHGLGKYIYKPSEGTIYEGSFKNNHRQGKGKLTFNDGSYYEGDFYNEQMDGIGTYVGVDGSQYEGEWSHNLRHGVGTQLYSDKTIYVGQFIQNKRQGRGVTHYKDGVSSHEGEWVEDVRVGHALGTHVMRPGFGPRGGPREVRIKVFGF